MTRRSRSRNWLLLWRYWGAIPFVFLLGGINNRWSLVSYFAASGLLIVYLVFAAPTYCGAVNRRRSGDKVEFCRNNSRGLLLGCSLRQHKWQKFHRTFWNGQVKARTRGMFDSPAAVLQTLAAVVGLIAAFAAVVKWFVLGML